ncbi:PPE domain-containing protein [Amycolatopsis silviterrae]|uniref:PPE domain-containing protein n=1 Tax=Amycolatopsis silviterrae TaxID=1656914 RepID=A0ABW5GYD2_9PSEU
MTPAEIYHQVTGGQGPESLSMTQKCAKDLSERLLDRADEIAKLAEKVRAGWHGVSAEEAANSASPLLSVSIDHSANLVFTQTAADGQLSAFQTVKNTVKPVGERPEITPQDVYDVLNGKDGYSGRLGQWQADAQHNIDAYTSYHSTTGANSDRIPARYAELSDTGASVSLASTAEPRKHPVKGPHKPSGEPPDSHQPGVTGPGPSAAVPPVPKPREPMAEPGSYRPTGHAGGREPDAAKGRAPAAPSEATKHPDATHPSSYRPDAPPGYQFGPVGQSINPVGSSGFDPLPGTGGSRGGAGNIGAGNRFGASREPAPPRNTPGTPSTTGKPANLLGGGLPAKKGEKDTDKEKPAPPYLQETDPDVFGVRDLKPTPPVIGDRPAR